MTCEHLTDRSVGVNPTSLNPKPYTVAQGLAAVEARRSQSRNFTELHLSESLGGFRASGLGFPPPRPPS